MRVDLILQMRARHLYNKPESANTSISNEPETLSRLALKVAALDAGMDTLIKNQDVFVKKHNGLITVVEYMDWSYEEQIRVLNPQYRSPVNGLDLKAVSLEQMPSVSMLTSARLLF